MLKKISLPAVMVLATAFTVLGPGTAMVQAQDINQAQDTHRIFHYPLNEKGSKTGKRALKEDEGRGDTVLVPGPAPWPSSYTDSGPVYYGFYDRWGDWHSYGNYDMGGYWHSDPEVVPLHGSGSSWF